MMKNKEKIVLNNFSFIIALVAIFLLIVIPKAIYAQDIVSLYKDLIPSPILDDSILKTSVNSRLTEKAKIHPELIYYNIIQLRNLYDKKLSHEVINNFIYQKQKYYLSRRNTFIYEQIAELNESSVDFSIRSKSKTYLNELLTDLDEMPDEMDDPFLIDHNLIDYVVFQYLTKDTSLTYDSTTDYHLFRLNAQGAVLEDYNYIFDSRSRFQPIKSKSIIQVLLQNWYIFADEDLELAETKQYNHLYEILNKVIEYNYSTNHQSRFTIDAGYCLDNSTFSLTKEFPVTYLVLFSYSQQPREYSNPDVNIKLSLPQFAGAFGYRIFINDYMDLLSYINLQLMVSISTGESTTGNTINNKSSYSLSGITTSQTEILKWESTLNTLNTYVVKAGVPLLIAGQSLFFELTINAGLLHYSSSTLFEYRMTRTESYYTGSFFNPSYYSHTIAQGYGEGNVDVNDNYFIIYPTLDICYETGLGIRFNVSASHKYFALFCGYSF